MELQEFIDKYADEAIPHFTASSSEKLIWLYRNFPKMIENFENDFRKAIEGW